MSEQDFRTNVLAQLQEFHKTQAILANDLTAIRTMLEERCPARGIALARCQEDIDALWKKEHKRTGGMAVLGALLGASGIIGGLVAKMLPFGGQ